MDTLLRGGTFAVDGRGLPVAVDSHRETLQRAMIRLTVPKGRFTLDAGLGSELYKLSGGPPAMRGRLAEAYVQEALATLPGVRVEAVDCALREADVLAVTVSLSVDGGRYGAEVLV
jgi:hypothetical protein